MSASAVPKKRAVLIEPDFCNECGLCLKVCREGALLRDTSYNARGVHPVIWTGQCSLCTNCKYVCTEYAIDIG